MAVVAPERQNGWSPRVVFVHALAAVFWGFIGMVAGERAIALTVVFGLGSVLVLLGIALHLRASTQHRARRVLLAGDSVPIALGAALLVYLVHDAVGTGTFGALVIDAGAALALFVPAAIGPWLVAYAARE